MDANDKKEKPEKKKKSLIARIINIVIWLLIIAWLAVVLIDFFHVYKDEDPKFCWFNEKTTSYDDGEVTECMGFGYKIYKYKRTSNKGYKFGPFWINDETNK